MSRPFRIHGKSGWWIRYTDEFGKRKKRTFELFADAARSLEAEKARVTQVVRGLRDSTPPTKHYDDLADYWTEFKVPNPVGAVGSGGAARARPSVEGSEFDRPRTGAQKAWRRTRTAGRAIRALVVRKDPRLARGARQEGRAT